MKITLLSLIAYILQEPLSYIFNLLCFVFKLMEETYCVTLSSCSFCDLMGLHLQVGMIAASFPFRQLLSIELNEDLASGALHKLRTSEFGKKSCPVSYRVGFLKVSYKQWASVTDWVNGLLLHQTFRLSTICTFSHLHPLSAPSRHTLFRPMHCCDLAVFLVITHIVDRFLQLYASVTVYYLSFSHFMRR